ncbi:hypothetical protein GCM10007863_18320 [Dyella mobilis]|nr:hypothetical protein GCM10007863_18320 [Dyella mobilis]
MYDGHDLSNVLLDVCAKLKYVRSLPVGDAPTFYCPGDMRSLTGIRAQRFVAIWGTPDLVQNAPSAGKGSSEWTYFLGSAKPGWAGGGFAELSLYFVNGVTRKFNCALAQ